MNKARLEGLSDATFAIVFTLLVIEIRVPEHLGEMTSQGLWHALSDLAPLFLGYVVSFAVLAMFWISHSFFYSYVVKNINRQLNALNLLFLSLVALIPFSAHLLGRYGREIDLAVVLYGINVFVIGLVQNFIFEYALRHPEIETGHNSTRLLKQGRIRSYVTSVCTIIGILFAVYVSTTLALFFYIFPLVFNIVPGMLDKLERLLGFTLE